MSQLTRKEIEKALSLFLDALEICDRHHEDVEQLLLPLHKGIGDCYFQTEKYEQALENFAECLTIQKAEFGYDSMELAATCVYQNKGTYYEATNFAAKALQINEEHHGKRVQRMCVFSLPAWKGSLGFREIRVFHERQNVHSVNKRNGRVGPKNKEKNLNSMIKNS